MEINQGTSGSSLTVVGGATTVFDVTEIDFIGATVADLGGGIAQVTITGTSPGGSDRDVQYNNSGSFAGDSGFTYSSGDVNVAGDIRAVGNLFTKTALIMEDPGGGTNTITLQSPTPLSASYILTLPVDDGTLNQVVTTNGSGVLFWTTPTTGTVTSVSGTANRITSTGGTTPIIDIAATYVGQSSITTLGTITSGTWNGSIITGTYGGTGVNNGTSTITLGGSLVTSGASTLTLTTTGATNSTFPVGTDTLAGLSTEQTFLGHNSFNGVVNFYGNMSLGDLVSFTWETYPSLLGSDQNNYNGIGQTNIYLQSTISVNITGIIAIASAILKITNVGSFPIIFKNENASSTATNRFHTSTGSDITLLANQTVMFLYQGNTVNRWRDITMQTGILPAVNFPALTGDITTVVGALATTLATVNSNVGTFGSSTSIPTFTVNAKGLITAASGNVVVAPAGTLTGTTLASNVVASSLTSVGTLTSLAVSGAITGATSYNGLAITANTGVITSGTWNGSVIIGTYGGTGVNNGTKTFTYLKNISFTAADDTGVYTFPTGTKTLLATDGSGASLSGIVYTITGTSNQITASASTGNVTLSVPANAQLSIAKITNLTTNGFAKTSGGDGTLSVDTATYVSTTSNLIRFVDGRLTLTTAVPVTTGDVTAATVIYFTPYGGDIVSLFDGSNWNTQVFTEKSIKTTDASSTNGSYTNGVKTVTGLSDTSQLMRGMLVTSSKAGISGGQTIASIDSATQITLSANATSTQSAATITFKLPASTLYDIFYVQSSGKLQFSNSWTSGTARNDALSLQNGTSVNNAAINATDSNTIAAKTGLYLGTISTTTTNGQTEDSLTNRLIWNNYNRIKKSMYINEPANSWNYTTATWRQANGNTGNQVAIVNGLVEESVYVSIQTFSANTSSAAMRIGVGENVTNAIATNSQTSHSNGSIASALTLNFNTAPALGYSFYAWLEYSAAVGTTTWFGDNGTSGIDSSGMGGNWVC